MLIMLHGASVCGTAWLCALHMAMRDPLRPPAGGHCPSGYAARARARCHRRRRRPLHHCVAAAAAGAIATAVAAAWRPGRCHSLSLQHAVAAATAAVTSIAAVLVLVALVSLSLTSAARASLASRLAAAASVHASCSYYHHPTSVAPLP